MSDSDLPEDGGGADLFGEVDNEAQSEPDRVLSDRELSLNQDDGQQYARDDDEAMEDQQVKEKTIMDVAMYRHKIPRAKDGMLQSLKVPPFLKWMAEEYKPDTFEPTEWDRENLRSENPKATVRYQKDPETDELKSNTLVYKWSDGSMSISVGGDHYEIQKRSMAPPPHKPYQERDDAHYYAAAAHLTSDLLLTVGHISEQYTVNLNRNLQDEARIKFANDMAAAARGKRPNEGDMIITATRDPELQKKEAELAEKERAKAQRRRENASARLDSSRAGNYRSGGLSIGDLEGGRRGPGGARKRGAPGASRAKRRRPEYDSDDDLPEGRGRQDEYDHEDDFIAPSDEDQMSGVDDDDEEDILDDDEEEEEAPRRKRQKTVEADDDADADADADLDDLDAAAPAESSRSRRRNIVADEDDDDDE
ncbi:Uu.00g040300.m01.CDS01 [Anthostomella pinea]|uniref:Uu.00g040300.m01.CDS01 n=1 Tax=Anthostomella pinea TaxID=933095 RepID=A0AAI8VAU4_9PEZI|nr:Uu.00g040300.m01.CDS01 [Anthostomella pinea]